MLWRNLGHEVLQETAKQPNRWDFVNLITPGKHAVADNCSDIPDTASVLEGNPLTNHLAFISSFCIQSLRLHGRKQTLELIVPTTVVVSYILTGQQISGDDASSTTASAAEITDP